jgi:hypothetical protein
MVYLGLLRICLFQSKYSLSGENDFDLGRIDDWPSKPRSADSSSLADYDRAVVAGVVGNLTGWGLVVKIRRMAPRRLLRA